VRPAYASGRTPRHNPRHSGTRRARSKRRRCEPLKTGRPGQRRDAVSVSSGLFADQFQRNGVIFGQRFRCLEWRHRCCQSGRSGTALLASLKSLQRTRPGRVGWKGDPFAVGTSIAALSTQPLRHPCCPNQPSHPCLTTGANWGSERYLNHSTGQLTVPKLTPRSRR
jgi:hypothetical protein